MDTVLKNIYIFSLCLFCLISTGELKAEQTGEIQGRVTEVEGEALPGVGITAKSSSLQGLRTALSDKNGNFRLPLLPVGEYSLTYEIDGFEKLLSSHFTFERIILKGQLAFSQFEEVVRCFQRELEEDYQTELNNQHVQQLEEFFQRKNNLIVEDDSQAYICGLL